jgi:transcriptional regulator with XRE-family HTH domain
MSTIGENILHRRKQMGMTQEELAKRLGYKSKSTINKIELGINDIPRNKIEKFAEALGTTPACLMGWTKTIKDVSNYSIAKNIQLRREEAGISIIEFANLLNVNEETVLDIENGKLTPSKELLFRICDVLHTTPDFLDGTIVELLEDGDSDAEYRYSRQQMPSPENLTEGEQVLLNLFRRVPEEQQQLVLQMIRAALGN